MGVLNVSDCQWWYNCVIKDISKSLSSYCKKKTGEIEMEEG